MGISSFTLNRIFVEAKDYLIGSKIERIVDIDKESYLLSTFKDGKSSSILLSLDPALPLLLRANSIHLDSIPATSYNCQMLKKYLDHASILDAYKKDDDRIIILKLKRWTQAYVLQESMMIFELFPLSPNIIFVDNNYQILDAFKHSTSLDSKHPIYKGLTYTFPPALDKHFDESTSLEQMKGKVNKGEYQYLSSLNENEFHQAIKDMLNEKYYYIYNNEVSSLNISSLYKKVDSLSLYQKLIEEKTKKLKEEKYNAIFKLVETKIKTLNKKIINIDKDKNNFESYHDYALFGQSLYLGQDEYHLGDKSININGLDIKLDPKLNLNENAQKYFKLYKKSKSGLVQVELQKQNAQKELDYFMLLDNQMKFASSNDMEEIIFDLIDHHYLKDPKAKNKKDRVPSNKKYNPHYLKLDNLKIGYGLSSYQNEELTFNQANKEDYYFHIKDYHGPHVILFKANPTNQELLLAGEIALYFADKQAGEVYYTKRKNLKKVPGQRGLVTMDTMSTLVINSIREETIKLIKNH